MQCFEAPLNNYAPISIPSAILIDCTINSFDVIEEWPFRPSAIAFSPPRFSDNELASRPNPD